LIAFSGLVGARFLATRLIPSSVSISLLFPVYPERIIVSTLSLDASRFANLDVAFFEILSRFSSDIAIMI